MNRPADELPVPMATGKALDLSIPIHPPPINQLCWAAVGTALERYYPALPDHTLCQFVALTIQPSCCRSGSISPDCNVKRTLADALRKIPIAFGVEVQSAWDIDALRELWTTLQGLLNDGHPVAVSVAKGVDRHFLVIAGWAIANNNIWLRVACSIKGTGWMPAESVFRSYRFPNDKLVERYSIMQMPPP